MRINSTFFPLLFIFYIIVYLYIFNSAVYWMRILSLIRFFNILKIRYVLLFKLYISYIDCFYITSYSSKYVKVLNFFKFSYFRRSLNWVILRTYNINWNLLFKFFFLLFFYWIGCKSFIAFWKNNFHMMRSLVSLSRIFEKKFRSLRIL